MFDKKVRSGNIIEDIVFFVIANKTNMTDKSDKAKRITLGILKFFGFLICFYFFICALELLTTSFKLLVGNSSIKGWLKSVETYSYPALMMVGVVGTMLVQSSSAFTSVVVAAIAAKTIDLKAAIPMIMGANFGTTITNTLVSMAHLRDRNELRRAVSASSTHDLFNWGTMLLFLGLEVTILAFSTNFCPIKIDMSGSTV